jgi:hypothetical protein
MNHPLIADAHPMEHIMRFPEGLDGLASDASRAGDFERDSLQGPADPLPVGVVKSLVLP